MPRNHKPHEGPRVRSDGSKLRGRKPLDDQALIEAACFLINTQRVRPEHANEAAARHLRAQDNIEIRSARERVSTKRRKLQQQDAHLAGLPDDLRRLALIAVQDGGEAAFLSLAEQLALVLGPLGPTDDAEETRQLFRAWASEQWSLMKPSIG